MSDYGLARVKRRFQLRHIPTKDISVAYCGVRLSVIYPSGLEYRQQDSMCFRCYRRWLMTQ